MSRKLVIIGDGACGKTSLLSVFTLGYFPTVSLLLAQFSEYFADNVISSTMYVSEFAATKFIQPPIADTTFLGTDRLRELRYGL